MNKGEKVTSRDKANLSFDVDAALLVELGERLVARRSVALAELIKNAYDADATEVTITFSEIRGPKGEIIVTDNGSGMTLQALKRGWMRIATTDALENAHSLAFGRPKTGAKGVGALCLPALGIPPDPPVNIASRQWY